MTIGTRIYTMLKGQRIGNDAAGNTYYQERKPRGPRTRRWVLYAGEADPSVVPAEWHAWLHHLTDAPLPESARRPWMKPHQPNMTGTAGSYRPAGADSMGGQRAHATGDYEAWTPGS